MAGHANCSLNVHGVTSCAKNYISDDESDAKYWALESFVPAEVYVIEPVSGREIASSALFHVGYETDEQLLTFFRLMSQNHRGATEMLRVRARLENFTVCSDNEDDRPLMLTRAQFAIASSEYVQAYYHSPPASTCRLCYRIVWEQGFDWHRELTILIHAMQLAVMARVPAVITDNLPIPLNFVVVVVDEASCTARVTWPGFVQVISELVSSFAGVTFELCMKTGFAEIDLECCGERRCVPLGVPASHGLFIWYDGDFWTADADTETIPPLLVPIGPMVVRMDRVEDIHRLLPFLIFPHPIGLPLIPPLELGIEPERVVGASRLQTEFQQIHSILYDAIHGMHPRRFTNWGHALEVGLCLHRATGALVEGFNLWYMALAFHRKTSPRRDVLFACWESLAQCQPAIIAPLLRVLMGGQPSTLPFAQVSSLSSLFFAHAKASELAMMRVNSMLREDNHERCCMVGLRATGRLLCTDLCTLSSSVALGLQIQRAAMPETIPTVDHLKPYAGPNDAYLSSFFGVSNFEHSIATAYHHMNRDRVLTSDRAGEGVDHAHVYDLQTNRWRSTDKTRTVKNELVSMVQSCIRRASGFPNPEPSVLDAADCQADRRKPKPTEVASQLVRIIASDTLLSNVTKIVYRLSTDHGLKPLFDQRPVVPFKNLVFALDEGRARPGSPFDLCIRGPEYDLLPLDIESDRVQQYTRYVVAMTRFEDVFKSYSQIVAALLDVFNPHKLFVFVHGPSNAGKSTWVEHIALAFGSFCSQLPVSHLTSTKDDPNGHTEVLVSAQGSRVVVINEPQARRDVIKKRTLKIISGNDKIQIRGLYQSFQTVVLTWKALCVTNDLPALDGSVCEATARRIHFLNLSMRFSAQAPALFDEQLRAGIFKVLHFDQSTKNELAHCLMHHALTTYVKRGMHLPNYKFVRDRRNALDALQYANTVTDLRTFLHTFLHSRCILGPISAMADKALGLIHRRLAVVERSIRRQCSDSTDDDHIVHYMSTLAAHTLLMVMQRDALMRGAPPITYDASDPHLLPRVLATAFPKRADAIHQAAGVPRDPPSLLPALTVVGFRALSRSSITNAFSIFKIFYDERSNGKKANGGGNGNATTAPSTLDIPRAKRSRLGEGEQLDPASEPNLNADLIPVEMLHAIDKHSIDMEGSMLERTITQTLRRGWLSQDIYIAGVGLPPRVLVHDSDRERLAQHYLYSHKLGGDETVSSSVDAVAWDYAAATGMVPMHISCLNDKEVTRHMSNLKSKPVPLPDDSQLARVLSLARGGRRPSIIQTQNPTAPFAFLAGIVEECFTEAWEDMSYSGDWMESQETCESLYKRVAVDWDAGACIFQAACMARSGERDALDEAHQFAGTDVTRITEIGTVPLSPPLVSMAQKLMKKRIRRGGDAWQAHSQSELGYRLFKSFSRTENLKNNTLNLCESDDDEESDQSRSTTPFLRLVLPILPHCLTGTQHAYTGTDRLDALHYDGVLPDACHFLLG
jgi:hypothetical protein